MSRYPDNVTASDIERANGAVSREVADAYDSVYEVHITIKAMVAGVVNAAIRRGQYMELEELQAIGQGIAETMESHCNWKETDISYYPEDWESFLKGEIGRLELGISKMIDRIIDENKTGDVW